MAIKNVKPKTGRLRELPARSKNIKYTLCLYIAGQTAKALTALSNLKSICDAQLKGKYRIEVIDLLKNPGLGRDHQILAIPTLKRKMPLPVRLIIGDLSNTERLLTGLGLNVSI